MNALRTTRVVIIDDDKEEALPLLAVLSKLGIGVLYYDGTAEYLPDKPLDGIRLIFLDLRLMGSLTSQPKHYISQTLTILQRTVNLNDGLTGIVYWTKHEEDKQEFEEQLAHGITQFKPAFLLSIANKISMCRSEDSRTIEMAIIDNLKYSPACRLLWDWEQGVHDAATETCKLLWDLTSDTLTNNCASAPEKKLLTLLHSLCLANGATTKDDELTCLGHLFQSLNPLHYDQLEQHIHSIGEREAHVTTLKKALLAKAKLSNEQKNHLNGIFLTAGVSRQRPTLATGNVYIQDGWNKEKDVSFFISKRSKKKLESFIRELFSGWSDEKVKALADISVPCLLEITPTCDHLSKKALLARLVAGVLIKATGDGSFDNKIRLPASSRVFAKQLEFCNINSGTLEGSYSIIVNARHLYSNPIRQLKLHKPVIRLRHHVMNDVQAWFASHAARPGYMSLR